MATIQEHSTAAEDRVPWNQLIAFGLGGLVPIALFNIVLQLVPLLGNISLGISAVWLGAILVLPRLWEALSDPVVGHLSDNARTRWGRRRPFILIGGIAVALSFVAMWWVPRENFLRQYVASDAGVMWLQLLFLLGTLLVFFTACAVFEIPHGALGLEMSTDYHERTRLFSAKSFLGNFFAMGTPWLIFFASLEVFSGPGGNLVDGMRYVSMIIAAVLAPMAVWWFFSLREPGFVAAREQKKSNFFEDMHTTIINRTFLVLTAIIFTLAMGFNFVSIFANYITIFYLYGGDVRAASPLLGITGTVWAVTALGAVFPLNWLGRRLGKKQHAARGNSADVRCTAVEDRLLPSRIAGHDRVAGRLGNVLQWPDTDHRRPLSDSDTDNAAFSWDADVLHARLFDGGRCLRRRRTEHGHAL